MTAHSPLSEPAFLRTTLGGIILSADGTAASLLNVSQRAAPGRNLLTFFNGERLRVLADALGSAAAGGDQFEARLRPRERKPLTVQLRVACEADGEVLEWTIAMNRSQVAATVYQSTRQKLVKSCGTPAGVNRQASVRS